MYLGRLWTRRQIAGFGTAQATNERYRFLLDHGQNGISTDFDHPTLTGYDSDHELAEGEVGRLGVAIDSVRDMDDLFLDIPLDKVSVSLTINHPAIVLLGMFLDPIGIMVLTLPLMVPLVEGYGLDLIWFGGIGTYIKAERENNVQVGDPANDAVRVDAGEVRAKVIGEGANLGVTQAGRIEFALDGGRINTDFIDNSAGVDCSDNEVNIKIALAAAKTLAESGKQAAVLSIMLEQQM